MQITFSPIGFNPHTSQVCFMATVVGKNGQDSFAYSGGILAFIPRTKLVPGLKYGEKVEVRFDLWAELTKQFRFELRTTNVESVIRGIREHRIDASKNINSPEVMRVFHAIASYARPDAVGLLYALLSDAQADGMSFGEWCEEYGCDEDSRKAETMYRACVDNGRKLQRILSKEEMAEAREMIKDY